jgi:uncharacterized protein YabN with tetrapyrrole methylase and pyrophosphatase domain
VSSQDQSSTPRIYIVGLGLRIDHLTGETDQALRESSHVYYVSHIPGIRQLLLDRCSHITDLAASCYAEGQSTYSAYRDMAATVINAALSLSEPVAFALYGHPLVLAQPSQLILTLATQLSLPTKVLPAISAMDCLFADLGVDPGSRGLQMHEATELLIYQRPILPDMATIIWQVGSLETALYTVRRSRPERLTRLKDFLLRFFPPDHDVFSVASAVEPNTSPDIRRFRITELAEYAPAFHYGTTLYIPPSEQRSVADVQLRDELTNPRHLDAITKNI